MPYQFIHYDGYGREGSTQTKTTKKKNGNKITTTKTVKSLLEILEEQQRIDGSCPHVKNPQKPTILYGIDPIDVLALAEEWAETAKDARGHKLRKDGNVCLVGVISLPRDMEDDFEKFAKDSLIWLQNKYGNRLKSVIIHNDEAHPHLHFCVVPNIGERFDDIHEGIKAKNNSKKDGQKAGVQNLAYIGAMREMQDDFSNKVAMQNGLTRLGPARRRLTRAAWKAEEAQAKYFANLKKIAKVAYKKAYKEGLANAKIEGEQIIIKAQETAKSIGAKIGGVFASAFGSWHKPTVQVLLEVEKVKKDAEEVKKAADKHMKKAEAVQKKSKEWADNRVAVVANMLTEEKTKNKDLIEELHKEKDKQAELVAVIQSYQKVAKKKGIDLSV